MYRTNIKPKSAGGTSSSRGLATSFISASCTGSTCRSKIPGTLTCGGSGALDGCAGTMDCICSILTTASFQRPRPLFGGSMSSSVNALGFSVHILCEVSAVTVPDQIHVTGTCKLLEPACAPREGCTLRKCVVSGPALSTPSLWQQSLSVRTVHGLSKRSSKG